MKIMDKMVGFNREKNIFKNHKPNVQEKEGISNIRNEKVEIELKGNKRNYWVNEIDLLIIPLLEQF